jgi:glycosyltransferase involved in cell wall biosynthesis
LTSDKSLVSGLVYHIETDLSEPFIIGTGNALYFRGWCYHTEERISKLSILSNEREYAVKNFALVRYDVFSEQFQKVESVGNSINSGFWVVIPFSEINEPRESVLSVRAQLSSGKVCESRIGKLNLVPSSPRKEVIRNCPEAEVAICMATFNPSIEQFQRQINSIMDQTYKNWICIINDDSSRIEIYKQMKAIAAEDRRFFFFRNSSNLGFYKNFERCLSRVPEDVSFIALSDQDDYWHENKLFSLISMFDEETMLVFSDMNIVDEEGKVLHRTYWTTRKNNYTKLDLLLIANTVTGAVSLFRRHLLSYLLPFPEKIGDAYHDHFIACIALAKGRIKYIDQPLHDYYQHPGNVLGHYTKEKPVPGKRLSGFLEILKKGLRKKNENPASHDQAVYYNHFPRRVHMAHVLSLRCGDMSSKNKRVVERFMSFEWSLSGLLRQVASDKFFRHDSITLGIDFLLLRSLLAVKAVSLYYRLNIGRITKKIIFSKE